MGAGAKAGAKLWLALCGVLFALALAAAPAQATKVHLFKETFGSAAQPEFLAPGPDLLDPASGDLLVIDFRELVAPTVSRFKPNGEADPFAALGSNTIDGTRGPGGQKRTEEEVGCATASAEEPASCDETPQNGLVLGKGSGFGASDESQLAIAPPSAGASAGNIYVTQSEARLIDIFAADGHYLGQITKAGATKLEAPDGIAVDAAGNLYISDRPANQIYKCTPAANPPVNADCAPYSSAVLGPKALAVGAGPSAGSLFVTRRTGGSFYSGGVFKLALAGGALVSTVFEGVTGPGAEVKTIGVDPSDGHLFALNRLAKEPGNPFSGTFTRLDEYDASGSTATLLSTTLNGGTGVAADGEIYVSHIKHVDVYDAPIVTVPAPVTEAATAITPTRATLEGTVNPDGVALTECVFEYVRGHFGPNETIPYDHSVECEQPAASIPTGSGPVAVHAKLTELVPPEQGHYQFRLRAANAGAGHVVFGADREFSTGPIVKAKPASAISGASATLNAEVNPDGAAVTECRFDYLTEAEYEENGGSFAGAEEEPCAQSEAEIGEGEAYVPVSAPIEGLAPATKYKWRVTATTLGSGTGGAEVRNGTAFTTLNISVLTKPAGAVTGSGATLNGEVNPGGSPVTECFFEWGASTEYGHTAPCEESEAQIGSGSGLVPVHAPIAGLSGGSEYHFRLSAHTGAGLGHGEDESLLTLGPRIDGEWASAVTTDEATLNALVNPRGQATTYRFEWGLAAAPFEHATAELPAGSGSAGLHLSLHLEGLEPGAAYRWRLLASSDSTTEGEERALHTYRPSATETECPNQAFRSGPAAKLPDCRAYEEVSPAQKPGAVSYPGGIVTEMATADGEKLTYAAASAFGPSHLSAPFTHQYIAKRGAGGWSTRSIDPPGSSELLSDITALLEPGFRAFTPDLCQSFYMQVHEYALAPGTPPGWPNLYRRTDQECGGAPDFETLLTQAPTNLLGRGQISFYLPKLLGFSADARVAAIAAGAALTPEANPDLVPEDAPLRRFQLYVADGAGGLRLGSVLPDGGPALGESFLGEGGTSFAYDQRQRHALAADGSLMYWTSALGRGSLYLRTNPTQPQSPLDGEGHCTQPARACTVPVSFGAVTEAMAEFDTASPDGKRAIFTEAFEPVGGGARGTTKASCTNTTLRRRSLTHPKRPSRSPPECSASWERAKTPPASTSPPAKTSPPQRKSRPTRWATCRWPASPTSTSTTRPSPKGSASRSSASSPPRIFRTPARPRR